MRGKKALLGEFWGRSGLAAAGLSLGLRPRSKLLILAYHRVLDLPEEDRFPGDPELVSASVADFERQMRFVRAHFTPLRFADVVQSLDSGTPLPDNALIVTFDDGHVDNYTNAFPILRALGVPATIFLSTRYIDEPHVPFWFDHVAQLTYFAPRGTLEVQSLGYRTELDGVESRRAATDQLLRRLKQEPNARRLAVMDELVQQFGRHVPPAIREQRASFDWEQAREMSAAGIEFGSHTLSHPILSQLDAGELQHELSASREQIRARTGQPVDTLAYPVGKADAYTPQVIATARACGYRLGVSYETGINPLQGFADFALRRLAVERYVSFGQFKGVLSMPGVFG